MGYVKVVLNEKIDNLGIALDVVSVKRGYAMNFLLPEGLANFATPTELKRVELKKAEEEKIKEKMIKDVEEIVKKIDKSTITFIEKLSEKGHLYGSITEKDIVSKLNSEFGVVVHVDAVHLDKHIKEAGKTEVSISLTADKIVNVTVKVEEEKSA